MGTPFQPSPAYWRWLASAAVLGSAGLLLCLLVLPTTHWFDLKDIQIYHDQSRWVAGQGRLYRDFPSEYPPLANLVFGLCRAVSEMLAPVFPEPTAYLWVWLTSAWLLFLTVGHLIATRISREAVWVWLAPGALFFALFRYDIYPAATTLFALFALREGKVLRGALWLGVTVALKGYALFLLPAFVVYVLQTDGWRTARNVAAVTVAPFALANLAVLGFAGWEGMLSPYQFHARRLNVGESSYDAFGYLFACCFDAHPTVGGRIPFFLQAGCALLAAAMRPRTFAELINSFLVALLGFVSFLVFHSPQYLLWVLPVAAFTSSPAMRRTAVAFGWLTFLYYPMVHVNSAKHVTLALAAARGELLRVLVFRLSIVLVTVCRFALMGLALREWWSGRVRQPESSEEWRVEFSRCQVPGGEFSVSEERRELNPTSL